MATASKTAVSTPAVSKPMVSKPANSVAEGRSAQSSTSATGHTAPNRPPQPPAPRSAVRGSHGMPTMRISTPQNSSRQTTPPASEDGSSGAPDKPRPVPEVNDRHFTHEDLLKGWEDFRLKHPERKILVNAMRTCRPSPTDNPSRYKIVLENLSQKDTLEQDLPELYRELREALGNQKLTFDIEVAPPDAAPRHLTQAELLKEIVTENPVIGEILNDFDCHLEH